MISRRQRHVTDYLRICYELLPEADTVDDDLSPGKCNYSTHSLDHVHDLLFVSHAARNSLASWPMSTVHKLSCVFSRCELGKRGWSLQAKKGSKYAKLASGSRIRPLPMMFILTVNAEKVSLHFSQIWQLVKHGQKDQRQRKERLKERTFTFFALQTN